MVSKTIVKDVEAIPLNKYKSRRVFLFVLVVVTVIMCGFLNKPIPTLHYTDTTELGVTFCKIPTLDPFDPSLRKYIENPKMTFVTSCPVTQLYLAYIDDNDVIRLNVSEAVKVANLTCSYNFFRLTNDTDLVYGNIFKDVKFPIVFPPTENFLVLKCFDGQMEIYEDVFCKTIIVDAPEFQSDEESPHVLILVLESMSRNNYLRFMKQTRHFMETRLNTSTLQGVVKVADNSYPNMIPFLTGFRINNLPRHLKKVKDGPYDSWPLLWNDFAKAGYQTLLMEDDCRYTLFNYLQLGFRHQPTSVYPRALFMHILYKTLSDKTVGYCYANRFVNDYFFDILRRFHGNNHSRHRLFSFAFLIRPTHVNFAEAVALDPQVRRFFDTVSEKGGLDNTLVILMGDHGTRYGDILKTRVGTLESRLPLMAIHIPHDLNKRYPHLKQNIEANTDRLVVWEDLHAMIMDIAKQRYTQQAVLSSNQPGLSLWRQVIPLNRTCDSVEIPSQYCVCNPMTPLSIEDVRTQQAAHNLVKSINDILSVYKNKCHKLSLAKIHEAYIGDKDGDEILEVTVYTKPGGAIFSGHVTSNGSRYHLSRDVERLNAYGNSSYCITNAQHRKLCTCKQQVLSPS